ncbi:MAG: patatin-like phospholipase family protein [Muribaculaceae bacterium]|nr:patatin-like phospholipase family protein [Muribaculaceae bacterium]
MNKLRALIIFLIIMLIYPIKSYSAPELSNLTDTLRPMSVGLVLSGGGAKGIAHIGVIQALEDNNIPIDYVVGTSMGAIVGGLYAAGYTPAEMMELLESKDFANWSTGQINESLTYYFFKHNPTPAMLNVSIPTRNDSTHTSSFLPSSIISPLPMNFAFMELFSAYTAQCNSDFNKLFVPYRSITSDVYHKHKIVCRKGNLGDAIRASMSFPVVFQPIEMDGVLVYDGGIYDNFPVDVMNTDFAPDMMIGVDVSNPDGKPKSNDLLEQLEDMIIQNNDYSLPPNLGIKLKIDLSRFSLLDFQKAPVIYQIGYDHAMSMMDSICSRITWRTPPSERNLRRAVFKSSTPYVHFDSVTVSGGTPRQDLYFKNIFTDTKADTFGLQHAKLAYYRAITGNKLRNLVPEAKYRPNDSLFTLHLKATVKDNLNVGFGGYITSTTNSMVFLTAGYSSLAKNHREARLNAWVGQSYMAAQLLGRIFISTPKPTSLTTDIVVSRMNFHQSVRFFYEQNPTYLTDMQAFGKIKYGLATGRTSKAEISAGFGHLSYRFYTTSIHDYMNEKRNISFYNLGQATIKWEHNTLNNNSYPTSGSKFESSVAGMIGKYTYRPANTNESKYYSTTPWARASINYQLYKPIGSHFSIGVEANAVATTRSLPSTYDQAIVTAEEYYPAPSTYNSFNPKMRAYSYVTAGVVPVYMITENLQLRGMAHCFLPYRRIYHGLDMKPVYGKRFDNPSFFGELAAVYNFPFAALTIYGSYNDAPSRHWSGGISFGLFFIAPTFF